MRAPRPEAPAARGTLLLLAWGACLLALALVPDQKILRWKLLALEGGVLALLAATVSGWLARPGALWRPSPLDLPVALYALAGAAFHLLSPEKGPSALELNRILFGAATYFAATQTLPLLKDPGRLLSVWASSAGLVGLYALLQRTGGLGPVEVPFQLRPTATFGNPIFLAGYLSASLVCGCFLALRGRSPAERRLAAASAAAIAAGLWVTQSRSALVGLAAASALAAILLLRGGRRTAALACLGLLSAAAFWWFRQRSWTHGLIWRDTLSLWLAHPWLGCGLGRFHVEFPAFASQELRTLWPQERVIVNFAHNEYLQVLAETGIVGAGLNAFLPVSFLLWLSGPGRSRPAESLSCSLSAVSLWAANAFSPDLRFGVSSFLLFFCLGAAVCLGAPPRERPFPAFPGRLACALLAAVFLAVWAKLAVSPALAAGRLSREPSFHVPGSERTLDAVETLEARRAASPEDADTAETLGYLYAKLRRWPEAVARLEEASRLDPSRPGPLNNLGNIHYSLGDREKALAFWKRSLAVSPDQLDAHLNMGKTLYELGRLAESSAHLQKVLERDPSNEKAAVLLKKMVE